MVTDGRCGHFEGSQRVISRWGVVVVQALASVFNDVQEKYQENGTLCLGVIPGKSSMSVPNYTTHNIMVILYPFRLW